ncbi:MAG: DUF1648 domain-containing protein [Terrisporobacter sp.]|uniref:DUF1648 domain-containing protein n=1 Tax=Terrisporobacter sp. TaxID=1965305 RepID=UPI002FC811EB
MKMAFTQKQRMIEGLTIFTLAAISIYVAVMWGKLPQEIPSNFAINGEISALGPKSSLITKLVVCYVIYIVFALIMFNPSTWGVGNIKDKKKQNLAFLIAADLFCFLKLILISIMAYIIFCILNNITLGKLFIPLACFMPLAIGFTSSSKIKALRK